MYEESLRIRRKVLGNEHPDVAQSLNNLALLLWNQVRLFGLAHTFSVKCWPSTHTVNSTCRIILYVSRTTTTRKQTVWEKKHCASQRSDLERTIQQHNSIEKIGVDFSSCVYVKKNNNSNFTSQAQDSSI